MISGDKVTVVLDLTVIIFHRRQSERGIMRVVLNEQERYKELLEDDSIAKVMLTSKRLSLN